MRKSEKKLMKARAERIWIEDNPHIHILNYPFYKFIRWWQGLRNIFYKPFRGLTIWQKIVGVFLLPFLLPVVFYKLYISKEWRTK